MRRHGVSIIEVIFAVLVATIGLLGALSVFPVAASIAKKGKVADMSAVVGKSAIADFRTRGMDRPRNWIAWNTISSSYLPVPLPVATEVRWNPATGLNETRPTPFVMAPQGVSLCIDPRFIAATAGTSDAQSAMFPYVPQAFAGDPRLARVTLANQQRTSAADPAIPMSRPMADTLFMRDDDLLANRPADSSLPAWGPVADGRRQSDGHFSWMATLVPNCQYLNPMGQKAVATPLADSVDDYVLSIVVFHQRPAGFDVTDPLNERIVGVDWAEAGGNGSAGGETLLFAPTADALKLRSGDWVMLIGNSQHTAGALIPVARWFRVTEADDADYHTGDSRWECSVSLSGGDWDAANILNQQVVIATGVSAVYEKTIKLDDLH